MKKFTLTLIAVVSMFLAVGVWQLSTVYRENQAATRPQRIVAAELENVKQAELNQIQVQQAKATAPAAAITPYFLLIIASIAVTIGAAVAWQRLYKKPLVRPDEHGRLPVSRDLLTSMERQTEALMLTMQTMQQAAQIQIAQATATARLADQMKITITSARPAAVELPTPVPIIAELPAPPVLTLPDNIGLQDVLPRVSPHYLAYGVLANGDILEMPLAGSYHGLRAGDTRTGKSNAIDSEICQLHHMAARGTPLRLYAADYKRELKATWDRSPLFAGGIETDAQGVIDILDYLVNGSDGILHRQDTFASVGAEHNRIIRNIGDYERITHERMAISVLFVDEINALLESSSGKQAGELESLLKIALQTGAASGMYIQGGAQYLSSAVMGRDASKQFVNRQYFGQWDTTAISMLFGSVKTIDESSKRLITGGKGRGLARTVTSQGVQPFQSLRCDEQDILHAIHIVTHGQSKTRIIDTISTPLQSPKTPLLATPDNVPAMPQIAPVVAGESIDTGNVNAADSITVPELERVQIMALAKAGIARNVICKQLYGSVNGREYAKIKAVLGATQ